jgi:hypothetical protein
MTTIINGSSPSVTFSDSTTQSTALVTPSAIGQVPFSTDGSTYTATAKVASGTVQNSTSGTSIDFTGIPSWVKRVTVMFNGVSTNGSSIIQTQIGNGSIITTGYNSGVSQLGGPPVETSYTSGFGLSYNNQSSNTFYGVFTITLLTGNTWVFNGQTVLYIGGSHCYSNGYLILSSSLDRVRITTVNGTDTFDAGSINILYE